MVCELEPFEAVLAAAQLALQFADNRDQDESLGPSRILGKPAAERRLQRAAKGEFILVAIEVVDVDAEAIAGGAVAHNANRVCSA